MLQQQPQPHATTSPAFPLRASLEGFDNHPQQEAGVPNTSSNGGRTGQQHHSQHSEHADQAFNLNQAHTSLLITYLDTPKIYSMPNFKDYYF